MIYIQNMSDAHIKKVIIVTAESAHIYVCRLHSKKSVPFITGWK